jgi:ATP-dependent protease ClpP protease subunit
LPVHKNKHTLASVSIIWDIIISKQKQSSSGGVVDRKELAKKIASTRTIPFFGRLNEELYELVRDSLLSLSSDSAKPITILFDSPGGFGQYMFLLGDVVSNLRCEVTGIAIQARSAACFLQQYCHKRLIMPGGYLLVHSSQPSSQSFATAKYNENWGQWIKMFEGVIESHNIELRKLLVRRTGLPEGQINEIFLRGDNLDYPIFAPEAKKLNLVDDIVPPEYRLYTGFPKRKEQKEEDAINIIPIV